MSRFARFSNAVLRSPLLWGVAIAVGLYSLLDAAQWSATNLQSYFPRHSTGYLVTITFWVALSSLAIKAADGVAQLRGLRPGLLGAPTASGQPSEQSAALIARLAALSDFQQASHLVRRFREALKTVERQGVESLDDELKYLSARDLRSLWQSFGWVILAVALLPIFGVVGTLQTMTDATSPVGNHPEFLASTLSQLMVLVVASAAMISFDVRLLRRVDACVAEELGSRFQRLGASNDPQVLAVRRMADAVVQVTDRLVQRQVELWQSTIQTAHDHWHHLTDASLEQTQLALETSLRKVLSEFADRLASTPSAAVEVSSTPLIEPRSDKPTQVVGTLKLFSPEDAPDSVPAEAKAA